MRAVVLLAEWLALLLLLCGLVCTDLRDDLQHLLPVSLHLRYPPLHGPLLHLALQSLLGALQLHAILLALARDLLA